jgi:hypothetical protein
MGEEKNGCLGFESLNKQFLSPGEKKTLWKKNKPNKPLNYQVTFVIVLKKYHEFSYTSG